MKNYFTNCTILELNNDYSIYDQGENSSWETLLCIGWEQGLLLPHLVFCIKFSANQFYGTRTPITGLRGTMKWSL